MTLIKFMPAVTLIDREFPNLREAKDPHQLFEADEHFDQVCLGSDELAFIS